MKKFTSISVRHRELLSRLLHRDLRRCSTNALAGAERRGWVAGAAGGYELTAMGRRVAEQSELAVGSGPMRVDVSDVASC